MNDKGERIVKKIGTLNNNKFTTKEVNIVQWNNKEMYIDIRKWSDDVAKKGVSLTLSEAKKLQELLGMAIASLENLQNNKLINSDYELLGIEEIKDSDVK